ncbi:MAG: ParB/RepB/Spo0J family partition protein [Thermoleophilaceae bacterium]
MSTQPTARRKLEIALDRIEVGGNVRELDAEHVTALAGSMAVRGLIVPIAVRPLDGERFVLVAGEHRLAAARELGWPTIDAVISDQAEGTSGDQGAENVLRKTLTPLEEARAVQKMLADGYTVDGAATVLGWHKRRVTARQRILELPEIAQTLVGTGEIPVRGIDALLEIQAVSPKLAALVAEVIAEASAEGNQLGEQLARDPGWLVRQALSHRPGELFAALAGGTLYEDQIAELKLGKKITALYAEAKTLHGQLDRYAYGPPPVRIGEAEIDQARAAGVLLELDRTQVILDRGVYRELVKAAVTRTVEDLRGRAQERVSEQRERKSANGTKRERTPREDADAEHRAQQREFTRRAHNVNLDLGAALLDGLATVDPDNMDVARFLAYGLLGPESTHYLGTSDHVARTIAANGIRLVLDEHRTTTTPTLKSGQPGKTKVSYGEPEDALKWLWKFVDGAKSAGELYGRTLVVFACQHYANQLALPTSQRRGSVLPRSHRDVARKAFEKVTKSALPASHRELARAIEREAREYRDRVAALEQHARAEAADDVGEEPDAEPVDDVDGELGDEDLEEQQAA